MALLEKFLETLVELPHPPDAYTKVADYYDDALDECNWTGTTLFGEEFLNQKVPQEAEILEICCGSGRLGQFLNQNGYFNLSALDGCRTFYEKAVEKGVQYTSFTEWFLTPDKDIPLPFESFDVILVSDAMYTNHISGRHLGPILKLLKKGGLFGCSRGVYQVEKWKLFNLPPEDFDNIFSDMVTSGTLQVVPGYPKSVPSGDALAPNHEFRFYKKQV